MRHALAILILATAAMSVPVASSAQAGFLTEVVKANIKNSARHANLSVKRAAVKGLIGATAVVCVAKAAAGRPCQ